MEVGKELSRLFNRRQRHHRYHQTCSQNTGFPRGINNPGQCVPRVKIVRRDILSCRRADNYYRMLKTPTSHTWIWQDGICLGDKLVTAQSMVAFLTSVKERERQREGYRERERKRKLDLMEIRPSRKYWSTAWTHLKRHSDKSSWEQGTRREDWMDRVKLKCSLRTEVPEGDTLGASRRVGWQKGEWDGETVGQDWAPPAASLIAHDWQECQVPAEGLGNWDERRLGGMQAPLDLVAGSCRINKGPPCGLAFIIKHILLQRWCLQILQQLPCLKNLDRYQTWYFHRLSNICPRVCKAILRCEINALSSHCGVMVHQSSYVWSKLTTGRYNLLIRAILLTAPEDTALCQSYIIWSEQQKLNRAGDEYKEDGGGYGKEVANSKAFICTQEKQHQPDRCTDSALNNVHVSVKIHLCSTTSCCACWAGDAPELVLA